MTNRTLQQTMFQAGCILAGLGVALGAFGAHGLKTAVPAADAAVFETGVKYQFIHALAILAMSFGYARIKHNVAKVSFGLFIAGIVLFSCSLYILGIRSIPGMSEELKWVGAITPLGGLSFIAGWLYLAVKGYKPQAGEDIQL
jgi:uncharacterized membrane protein YgdD (TMEM256/DUF423 family)